MEMSDSEIRAFIKKDIDDTLPELIKDKYRYLLKEQFEKEAYSYLRDERARFWAFVRNLTVGGVAVLGGAIAVLYNSIENSARIEATEASEEAIEIALSSQGQLVDLLDRVSNQLVERINDVNGELGMVQGQVGGAQGIVDRLLEAGEEIEGLYRQLEVDANSAARQQEEVVSTLQELRASGERQQEMINGLEARVALSDSKATEIERLLDNLELQQATFESLEDELNSILERSVATQNQIQVIADNADARRSDIEQAWTLIGSAEGAVTRMQEMTLALGVASDNINTNQGNIESLNGFRTEMLTRLATHDARIENTRAELSASRESLSSGIDTIFEEVTRIDEENLSVEEFASFASEFDLLQRNLRFFEDDVGILWGRVNTLETSFLELSGVIGSHEWITDGTGDAIAEAYHQQPVVAFDHQSLDGEPGCPSGWVRYEEAGGRFLLGAGAEYPVGNTGGEDEITLELESMPSLVAELPHNTLIWGNFSDQGLELGSHILFPMLSDLRGSGHAAAPIWAIESLFQPGEFGAQFDTGQRGSDQAPVTNMPPYIALYFCTPET